MPYLRLSTIEIPLEENEMNSFEIFTLDNAESFI